MPSLRPPPVAVHDNRHVPRPALGRHVGERLIGSVQDRGHEIVPGNLRRKRTIVPCAGSRRRKNGSARSALPFRIINVYSQSQPMSNSIAMHVPLHCLRFLLFLACLVAGTNLSAQEQTYDLVIYGGTSGGVAAAIQARRMGKTAVVIEPGKHLGGLTSGGLGATDIGNKAAIGGISREFYQRIKKHYSDPANWRHEKPENYRSGRASELAQEDAMWTFEPSVAERLFDDICREAGVIVVKQERLDLKSGVEKRDGRIVSIRMESGKSFRGQMYVDATYEGDLMAKAGVSYTVGREANSQYGETLNGVQ